jgi:hypothetical protein
MEKLTVQDLAMFYGGKCEVVDTDNIPAPYRENFATVGDRIFIDAMTLLAVWDWRYRHSRGFK